MKHLNSYDNLIRKIASTWPKNYQISESSDFTKSLSGRALHGELSALQSSEPCCLPCFDSKKNIIIWYAICPSYAQLNEAIEDLSAWILPSLGWERPEGAFVNSGKPTNTIEKSIFDMHPSAGIYKWSSNINSFEEALSALSEARFLKDKKPSHVFSYAPSLFELRLDFKLALIASDRTSAEAVIGAIKSSQLDSSHNICFMYIFLWDKFQEYQSIVQYSELRHIVSGRMPAKVRDAIIRAFYYVYIEKLESNLEFNNAAKAYRESASSAIERLLEFCESYDAIEIRHMFAYQQAISPVLEQIKSLREGYPSDKALQQILDIIPKDKAPARLSMEELFWEARKQGNWKKLQSLGLELAERSPQEYVGVLRKSLEFRRNDLVEKKIEFMSRQSALTEEALPKSWSEALSLIKTDSWSRADRFFRERPNPPVELSSDSCLQELSQKIEELLTDPDIDRSEQLVRRLKVSFEHLAEDFLCEPLFPRDAFAHLYYEFFSLMDKLFRGTAKEYIWQGLLELGKAALEGSPGKEQGVLAVVKEWWEARKSPALLPFVLEAIECFYGISSNKSIFENLWIDAVVLAAREVKSLSPSDIELWREIGLRIGLSLSDINTALPASEIKKAKKDVIEAASLKKIAIVSLREKQAQEAQKIIQKRTKADVFCVSEEVAGPKAKSAAAADVILFVWSAVKHAVFRAFDQVDRDRIAYVSGTGSASIVRALERWIIKNNEK